MSKGAQPIVLERYSEAPLPTRHGALQLVVYRELGTSREHCALVAGDIRGASEVLTRVHSECITGEVFQSLKCDCREQLELALQRIVEAGQGVVLYLRQEGRGIGLGNKIRAYALQHQGVDTVDANTQLGFAPDQRTYQAASAMLQDLGVQSVVLMTNNPNKVDSLRADGIDVVRRASHTVEPNAHNLGYLRTKRERMGHLPRPVHADHFDAE